MSQIGNIILICLAVAIGITIIVLLILKNRKDRKLLNPDATDAVEEAMGDHNRRRNKV